MQPATGKQPAVLQKFRKLRVDNVPATVDTVQLRQLFGKHGEVEKVHLIRGRKKSCGIVKYRFATSAVEATKHLNGYLLMNACLEVAHTVQVPVQKAKNIHPAVKSHSQPPLPQAGQSGSQQKVRKLQVDAIPTTMDEAELRQLFEKHGDVAKVHLIRGRKKSRGIVKYTFASSAEDAIRWYSRQGMLLKVAYTAKTKAPKAKAPIPVPLKARQDEGKVAELQRELLSATRQHTLAMKALQRQHQAEIKRLKGADRMTQRLICRLSSLRLPTFSTSKPADNDKRMEEWIESKEPSDAFEVQVQEIRLAFQAAFPHGCFFYGSSSAGSDSAMNDSDVDLAVVYPFALSLIEHLRRHVPLLTITSRPIDNPNCQTAVMYHWTYKDLEGEVVVFTDERAFKSKMDEIRADPVSNLSERKTKGVKFMKRLRIAAFGALGHPKSRVLTHVVHEVHLQEPGSAAGYSYTHYIPLYLDAFLKLSEANFPYYNRYNEAEWLQLKNVVRCVKRSFGLPLQPGEVLPPVEEDTRSSWL